MKEEYPSSLSRGRKSPSKKLKLVCSFNGRFRRRHADGKLRYAGGETRIISVEPTSLTYLRLRSTISEVFRPENPSFSLKYQLPGSDGDCPLVLVASDDDVRCMVEEYESVESFGKPSRLWLFVCNRSDDYYYVDGDDNDEKDSDGNFVVEEENDGDDLGCGFGVSKWNSGFRGEKTVGSVKGCGNVSGNGLRKGFSVRNGLNGRRVSDHSLRKLVLKQQLLARQLNQVKKCDDPLVILGLEKNEDHPLIDLGPDTLDAKTGDVLDSNGLGYDRIAPCKEQLPSDQNLGGLIQIPAPRPRPLNPRDDNLFEEKHRCMKSSMTNCAQELAVASVMKQELGFNERVSSQYRENILPSSQDLNTLNSNLSCGNQVAGSPSMDKSFRRGHGVLGYHCSIGNNQFSLNDIRAQGVVCRNYNRSHHTLRVGGKTPTSARCYPGLGACTTMLKQGHRAMRLNYPNLPTPFSGQQEYKSDETRRLMIPIWNDQASTWLNRATIEKHAQVHHGVNIHPPQVMEDSLIDFSEESSGNKFDVPCEQYSRATIKYESSAHDANFSLMDAGSENAGQGSGIIGDAANLNGMMMHVEENFEVKGDCHTGSQPTPLNVACSLDVSSYNASPADSRASNEVSEELEMAHLKLLDLTLEAKELAETKMSNGNILLSNNDIMAQAMQEEMRDHSHATPIINDNADTSRSHKLSNMLNEMPSSLAAFYSHLATRELQTIKDSDLEYIKELGSGNYGTVYYGKWKGSDVAIKKIKPSCFSGDSKDDDRLVADFWKEARMLGQLHHPNIVAFYGIVSEGPITNLATVTEYMINGSLKEVLQRKDRTMDRRKRLIIAMDAAFGMEYLHEKNIVHFDLKSHNFLVNMRDSQRPVCKIGDLGLSKIKQRTLVSGGVRGTIPWMAPELLSTTINLVTEKVDVYSFGIVMWELLTGEEPYANMRSQEILAGIMKGTLRPEVPSWCDPGWRSLMERCWSSDTKSRPPFSEVAKELRTMSAAMNIK